MSDKSILNSANFIDHILNLKECETLEFKRVASVSSVLKAACAMANTDGGLLILGVGDERHSANEKRLYGIDENPEAIGEIKRGFQELISPSLYPPNCNSPDMLPLPCQLRDGSSGTIQICVISKSNTVHSFNNETYVRAASQNRKIGAPEIHRLCLSRGVDSYVNQPVEVPVELLDTEWWHQYASRRKLTRKFPDSLKHIGLMKKTKSGKWTPTVAAVLLFAEEPNGPLNRKCSIRIFHYKGHNIEYGKNTNLIKAPVTISGPILAQIRETIRTIEAELNSGVQRTTKGFEFHQKYPIAVIQEAITNAVLHRDYSILGDILIRIFTNRIEIESPGVFPGEVTPHNIGEIGSRPRNPKLTDHVREFPNPPNLDAGEGVRMMQHTLETSGLYPPVFEESKSDTQQSVLIKLSNEAKLSEWDMVEDHLGTHETINNYELRKMLNLEPGDSVRASRFLKRWVDSGMLEICNPLEGTRKRKYRLKRKKSILHSLFSETKTSKSQEILDIRENIDLQVKALFNSIKKQLD